MATGIQPFGRVNVSINLRSINSEAKSKGSEVMQS